MKTFSLSLYTASQGLCQRALVLTLEDVQPDHRGLCGFCRRLQVGHSIGHTAWRAQSTFICTRVYLLEFVCWLQVEE